MTGNGEPSARRSRPAVSSVTRSVKSVRSIQTSRRVVADRPDPSSGRKAVGISISGPKRASGATRKVVWSVRRAVTAPAASGAASKALGAQVCAQAALAQAVANTPVAPIMQAFKRIRSPHRSAELTLQPPGAGVQQVFDMVSSLFNEDDRRGFPNAKGPRCRGALRGLQC
ncbi:hypothetical protein BREVUG8_70117 [Brevundimonas sp. G8]|nr:hypothetical protein BREVUG8_70117 [Brevundimonas sp. G8]